MGHNLPGYWHAAETWLGQFEAMLRNITLTLIALHLSFKREDRDATEFSISLLRWPADGSQTGGGLIHLIADQSTKSHSAAGSRIRSLVALHRHDVSPDALEA